MYCFFGEESNIGGGGQESAGEQHEKHCLWAEKAAGAKVQRPTRTEGIAKVTVHSRRGGSGKYWN